MVDDAELQDDIPRPRSRLGIRLFGDAPDKTNRTIAIATLVIALSALVQIVVAVAQYREMKNGGMQTADIITAAKLIEADLKTANSQNQDALTKTLAQSKNAMDSSNQQSRRALDDTVAQFRLEQRAWVGLTIAEVPVPLPLGKPFDVVDHFLNSGKTPAIRTHAVTELDVDSPGRPTIYKETDALEGPPLLPSAELRTTSTVPSLTQENIDAIKAGTLVIYNRGAVWYWDVFGKKHITTYCLAYNSTGSAFHADPKIPCDKQESN